MPTRNLRNFSWEEVEVCVERRQFLAERSHRLFQRYWGLNGEGICSEAFAEYHMECGELLLKHKTRG